jgi:hypothetical protein
MATLPSAEQPSTFPRLRRTVAVLVLIAASVLGGVFVFASARRILESGAWIKIAQEHFAAVIGLPAAALASLFVVIFLEAKSGRIRFEALGFKFDGASGEVVLFVLVFLAFSSAIRMLW